MGALDGLKVVDLSRLLPGPFCTTLLADHGALFGGQRPYSLVLATDQLIDDHTFETYGRACNALRTYPALLQLQPDDVERIVRFARFEASRFAIDHLVLAQRASREAALDLDLGLEEVEVGDASD